QIKIQIQIHTMSTFTLSAQVGDQAEATTVVDNTLLATSVGSGDVEVYSTPSMIALMERAAVLTLNGKLDSAWTTVGTSINISHLSATPVNMSVRAVATITAIDNRKITYNVEAFDSVEKIGEGVHERFAVDKQRFMSRTNSKGTPA
ncbi:hypothetical protein SAMD00019534_079020, partial [Acytostelium subglobosum LB1]|uniref:hypothetical protein n=1 Tax=Acytostelium subglobosum LB1 TaxID=1410327 RepID=UPI00064512CE